MFIRHSGKKIRVDMWFGSHREMAVVSTIKATLNNMFKGVLNVRLYLGWDFVIIIYAGLPLQDALCRGSLSHQPQHY